MKKDFKILMKEHCCSRCKSDFDKNSLEIIHKEKDYYVIHLTCQKCGKDFGISFLKLTDKFSEKESETILQDSRNTPPINYDDVIDAHRYIKDFEQNWKKYIDS